MKALWDGIQALLLVLIVGAVITAIPILAIFLAVSAVVVIIYTIIKDNNRRN